MTEGIREHGTVQFTWQSDASFAASALWPARTDKLPPTT
jgi:hypothetical protein